MGQTSLPLGSMWQPEFGTAPSAGAAMDARNIQQENVSTPANNPFSEMSHPGQSELNLFAFHLIFDFSS